MARILILTLVYEPDRVSTATLMGELARGLQSRGHEVTVLTSVPHYNPPPAAQRAPLRLCRESVEASVRVLRVPMPLKRERRWSRAFDYLWFQFITTVLALWRDGYDVVFVSSPPIALGLSGLLLARLRGALFVYNVQELWPDVPIQLGMIRNRVLIRVLRALEMRVYKSADAVCVIAGTFRAALAARGVASDKLHHIPNFVDTRRIQPGDKVNSFSVQHGLDKAFVVLYAGNIGLTQGVEVLVEAGKELREETDIQILIVGGGAARSVLERAVASSGLQNIRLLPLLPAADVPGLYASADVCVVPLRRGFSRSTVPSKILTAMAAGRAVILSAEADSEVGELLQRAGAGLCVPPESPRELAAAIRLLRDNREKRLQLGVKGREWVEAHYSLPQVVGAYDDLLRRLTRSPGV